MRKPRRGYGDGGCRQRSPGTFELRYSVGVDEATGKRRIATLTVRGTAAEARAELRRRLEAVRKGEHVDPHRITVAGWLGTWLGAVRQEVAPTTYRRYREIVDHYLTPRLGQLPLLKLAPMHIQEAYNALGVDARRDGRPGVLAPRTRRHIHRILSGALERAVEQQLLARNPAAVFRRGLAKVECRAMVTLDPDQATALLAAIRHSHIYWPALLALSIGARRGEILALRWHSIDLERGEVRIVASLEQIGKELRFKAPKTERHRTVTLPAFAVAELRAHKSRQAEDLLALGIRQTGQTLVCARQDGEPLQPQSLTHEFPRFLGRLGADFPRVRFHDLRHSHATLAMLAGVHPKVVQERLGHSTISTTLDLYSHVTATMQEDAANRLDAVLRRAGQPE
jgi:integrase